jgi:PAS domain S-box-containing protein
MKIEQQPSVPAFRADPRWPRDQSRLNRLVFTVVVTGVTLGLRLALHDQLRERSTLVAFTVPIILSAYVGGLPAGLLATVLSYVGASYFLIPPLRSFRIANVVDRWDLFFLVLAGVAISVLNEALHRARHRAAVATNDLQSRVALVKAEALQTAIFNSVNFSSIATDEKGVIQIFNVGAERMLGYTAAEVVNKLNPADISDPQEMIARASALSIEMGTQIAPGLETLVYKASRGIEYIYEPTFIRKDGTRFPAVVSVAALRDAQETIIGYLLIGTDNTARKHAEEARKKTDDALRKSEAQLQTILENINEAVVVSDLDGKLLHFNHAALDMMRYASLEEGRRQFSELADTFELSGIDGADWPVTQWPMARILRGEKLHDLEARMRRINTPWERIYSFGGTIAHDPDGKPLMAIVTFSDITERKLAAGEIRKLNADLEQRVIERTAQLQTANESLFVSQDRYRSLVDSAKEYAILTLDVGGYITTWNAGALRIKGYEADEIIGKHFSCFYPTEDVRKDKPQLELEEAVAVGQFEEDGWRVRKDGSHYWANVLITVLRDSHGIHTGFSKIVRDLTLRKQAEEKLRVSEEWLRSLVEGGKKYAIITMDTQGCVTTWNAGAERIKGYRADEVLGKHISRFYTPEDVQRGTPDQELKVATETGQYEEDGWRVRKDGSRFWANVLISSLRDSTGKHLGFSKITRDLTDIMKAEEQARNFFSLSLELLCIAGVDGYFKVLNPAWQNTLGFTQAELCAKPFVDFVHPDDLPATHAATKRITAAQPLNHFENRYRCKDGTYRWLLWKVALSDDLQLMHCAATDITQIKQTEGEIAGLNKSLQLQNLELVTANKELEAFSYSVSHDLRAPLRSIDGFSKAILEDYTDKLDSTGQDYLQRVRAGSQRMGQLIDDMLNLSRVSRGDLLHDSTDLSQIAREIVDECRASSKERDVQMKIADGLIAAADPRLMRVVLTNLLGNAWKFTGKTAHPLIEFGCNRQGGSCEYFVRDNGAGFDMAYASKLFGAFQRLHSDRDFPGTGIGLATIQRIVHRHGGQVRAESKPDEGATFYFTLGHQNAVETQLLQIAH